MAGEKYRESLRYRESRKLTASCSLRFALGLEVRAGRVMVWFVDDFGRMGFCCIFTRREGILVYLVYFWKHIRRSRRLNLF